MKIDIKFLHPDAKIPSQSKFGDAGYDLRAVEPIAIGRGQRALVKTGISIAIPAGYYGRIAPRSGLALKNGIDVLAGVIDSTYRGEIGVILLNTEIPSPKVSVDGPVAVFSHGEPFRINVGDRIAQIIFEKYHTAEFCEVEELDKTERGDGGFGASGR